MRKQRESLTAATPEEKCQVLEQLQALYYELGALSRSCLFLDMSILDRCDFLDEDQVGEIYDTYYRAHYTSEASTDALRDLRERILCILVDDLEQELPMPQGVSEDDLPVDCPGWARFDYRSPLCQVCPHGIPCLEVRAAMGPRNDEIEA